MSRLLVRSSSNRYISSGAPIAAYPFTFVGRARFTAKGATAQTFMGLFRVSGGGGDYVGQVFFENRSSQNIVQAMSSDDNNWFSSSGVAPAAEGTWFNFAGIFASSSSRQAWVNGTYDTANTETRLIASVNQLNVGAYANTSGSYSDHFDGDIADYALLNIAPTAAQLTAFNKGFTPREIWPAYQIVDCWDFYGTITNEPGRKGTVLTPNGTPAKSAHPRVIYPAVPSATPFSATAAAASPKFLTLLGAG